MADTKIKNCKQCGSGFEAPVNVPGMPRRYCSDRCRWVWNERQKGKRQPKPPPPPPWSGECFHCKSEMTGRKRKFCGDDCRAVYYREVRPRLMGVLPWGERKALERAKVPLVNCPTCGKEFRARLSKANGQRQRFCSRPCARLYDPFGLRCEIAAIKRIASRRHRSLDEIKARRMALLAKRAERKLAESSHACTKCGTPMPRSDLRLRTCEPCAQSRRRAERALAKARRRALLREGERVDPIKVFERDGWRCHLCGGKTLKAKRGTYHDRAPELDHVVPLAKGGQHTYANTACACRKCNIAKADRIIGQPSLIAA